ncbi:MAG TPA: DUF3187 family protein [Gemmatimonadales bacterium]|nr:DUF3187 family protein [Gemmatimonadales bacterium]
MVALSLARLRRLACCLLPLLPGVLAAQGLPSYMPVNPMTASRSGVYFQPYIDPDPGGTHVSLLLDYGSAIEYDIPAPRPSYLLDAELLRVSAVAVRDLDARSFLLADLSVDGAYAGFLDGFLNWYHRVFGFELPERDARPENQFAYRLSLPNGTTLVRKPSDLFLGDVRLGYGRRWSPAVQTLFAATLPTSTGPDGYGRGTISVSALSSARVRLSPRLTSETGLGLGVTPRHGELGPYQRSWFLGASTGLRFRFWGRQSLFANLLYHSPYYHDTTLPALDASELSLDFGWLLRTKSGREWKIGLTEDLKPKGPAIDVVFRLGMLR